MILEELHLKVFETEVETYPKQNKSHYCYYLSNICANCIKWMSIIGEIELIGNTFGHILLIKQVSGFFFFTA